MKELFGHPMVEKSSLVSRLVNHVNAAQRFVAVPRKAVDHLNGARGGVRFRPGAG